LCEENRATFIHASSSCSSTVSSSTSFSSSSSFLSFNHHLCPGGRGLWGTREKKGQKENGTGRERTRDDGERGDGHSSKGEKKGGKLAE